MIFFKNEKWKFFTKRKKVLPLLLQTVPNRLGAADGKVRLKILQSISTLVFDEVLEKIVGMAEYIKRDDMVYCYLPSFITPSIRTTYDTAATFQ